MSNDPTAVAWCVIGAISIESKLIPAKNRETVLHELRESLLEVANDGEPPGQRRFLTVAEANDACLGRAEAVEWVRRATNLLACRRKSRRVESEAEDG